MPALCATRKLPRSLEWAAEAVCVSEKIPPREFDVSSDEAKRACERCPVRMECLEHLLSWDQQVGWGAGLSESRRQKMVRRRGEKFMRVDPRARVG